MAKANEKFSFELGIKQLEDIVKELESGDMGLADMLKRYEEGVAVARLCGESLDKAEAVISMLTKNDKGDMEEVLMVKK